MSEEKMAEKYEEGKVSEEEKVPVDKASNHYAWNKGTSQTS